MLVWDLSAAWHVTRLDLLTVLVQARTEILTVNTLVPQHHGMGVPEAIPEFSLTPETLARPTPCQGPPTSTEADPDQGYLQKQV